MYIKLDQYRIFCEAADSESFSAAAAKLFMSQSAVSQQIKSLEQTLNARLFIRSKGGTRLTREGMMLYEYAKNAISLLGEAENRFERLNELCEGELRIGAGDTVSKHYLLPRLERFHNANPKIKIQIINRVTSDALKMLSAGKIDIAFVNLPLFSEDKSAFSVTSAIRLHDIFVAKKGLFSEKSFTAAELAEKPLIMLEPISNSRKSVDRHFLNLGIGLKPEIELGSHDLMLDFASSGLGIACVIREYALEYLQSGKLTELQTDFVLPERSVGICTLNGVTPSAATSAFIKQF